MLADLCLRYAAEKERSWTASRNAWADARSGIGLSQKTMPGSNGLQERMWKRAINVSTKRWRGGCLPVRRRLVRRSAAEKDGSPAEKRLNFWTLRSARRIGHAEKSHRNIGLSAFPAHHPDANRCASDAN